MKFADIDVKAQPFDLLFPQDRIERRIRELGQQISEQYADKKLILLGVLKGCFIFMADLVRAITIPIEVEFISASSYVSGTEAGALTLSGGPESSLRGRHILLVEAVVDTGRTANAIMLSLKRLEPASIEIVTLLDKTGRRETDLQIKFSGFTVGNDFVIGYGLDHNQFYRNLPFIGKVIAK